MLKLNHSSIPLTFVLENYYNLEIFSGMELLIELFEDFIHHTCINAYKTQTYTDL